MHYLLFSFHRSFVDEIDLSGMAVDVALRKFQSYFRLPVSCSTQIISYIILIAVGIVRLGPSLNLDCWQVVLGSYTSVVMTLLTQPPQFQVSQCTPLLAIKFPHIITDIFCLKDTLNK